MTARTETAIDLAASVRRTEFAAIDHAAYFNHASDSPLPRRSGEAIAERVRLLENPLASVPPREGYFSSARDRLGRMMNIPPGQIAFTTNSADATAIVANGLPWQLGDEVLFIVGEFASFVYPWRNLASLGVTSVFLPRHGVGVDLSDVEAAITARTRVVAISHVEYRSGYRVHLDALGEICRRRRVLLVVDASQSLGAIPIDAAACGAAAVISVGYKWLMAPHGIGVLYISETLMDRVRPTAPGRYSVADGWETVDYQLRWQPDAWRYQNGALNWIGVAALAESLGLLDEVGFDVVYSLARRQSEAVIDALDRLPVEITSDRSEGARSTIVSFTLGSTEKDDRFVAEALDANLVCGRRGFGVRIGTHFWNSADDASRLRELIGTFAT